MVYTRPSVIILPGSFCPPGFYFPVRDAVAAQGIDIQVLALSTVSLGANDTRRPPSMHEDTAAIVQEIEKLADDGKDVIVVAHSYSGIPLTEAAKGLGKESRKQQGKRGGLIKLAYLASLVPGPGQSASDIQAGNPPDDSILVGGVDDQGWMFMDHVKLAEAGFPELSPHDGLIWAKRFSNHSAQSFLDKSTQLGYLDEDLSVSYAFHGQDRIVSPSLQKGQIKMVEELSGRAVSVTSISAGHMSVITAPSLVVDWIVKLAQGQEEPTNDY